MKKINPTPSKGSTRTSTTKTTTTPCCSKIGIKRGPWTSEEDEVLANYINKEGEGQWRTLPNRAGLLRCGKSCRLRWMNYLRPSVKRGRISPDEEDLILRLHRLLGNRWSLIAGRIPGRTDNEVKNYWNTHLSKKLISQGIDPRTHKPLNLNPNPTSSTHDQPNQSSNPNSFRSPQETCNRAHPHRAIATKVSENFTMANFQNKFVEDAALNWPSYDGFVMHGQNVEDYMGSNGNEDTFSSFLDTLMNESVFVSHQHHQPNIISASVQHQPMVSYTQNFNHDTIWEADVLSSMVGLGGEDGFVHNNHPA